MQNIVFEKLNIIKITRCQWTTTCTPYKTQLKSMGGCFHMVTHIQAYLHQYGSLSPIHTFPQNPLPLHFKHPRVSETWRQSKEAQTMSAGTVSVVTGDFIHGLHEQVLSAAVWIRRRGSADEGQVIQGIGLVLFCSKELILIS